MGVAGFITITFIILFGALFIHITNKINKMEINTRDRGAEIDSSLWDRTFRLSRICSLLNAKGIENELECPDVNALGLGVSAPMASLGSLCSDALESITLYPYRLVFRAIILTLIVLTLNLIGDGLRDALDPRLKK